MKFAVPEYTTAEEIKAIRKELKLTQKEFSDMIGCSRPTVERWERSDKPISGPIVLLLYMMKEHMNEIAERIVPEQKYPLRMWYMYKQMPCTLIDVDMLQKRVEIHNYTNQVMFRAFGNNQNPTFEDYEEFLESRCFPRERDKMKLILRELDLPFYDPLMIVEKTKGRMAEDDFWLKIER